jgi:RsmE family RNA methyltransferase
VNLLLVEPAELGPDDTCTLADERAQHLRDVLGARAGSQIRTGIIGGAIGSGEVLTDDGARITLRFVATGPPPPQLPVELVLAVPRPKVLSRVVEACASFAIRRVDLTNAWRVDKSYLSSPRLEPEALARATRLGAAQGATTHLPELHVHARLMELLDTRFPPTGGPLAIRLVAHPGMRPIEEVVTTAGPTILAIGPEGGWIERELDTFVARGFAPVALGAAILRVETAVAAALGQLALLERLRRP